MRSTNHKSATIFACLLTLLFTCASLTGCASEVKTTTAARPLPPEPRPAPVTPASAAITEMVFAVGSKPDDTDGNSFPDRIEATIMLFAPPHPSPKFAAGTIDVALYPYGTSSQPNASPIARWTITGEALERAKRTSTIGPHYQLALSLLETGTDQYALALADLTCTFTPENGNPPVKSDGVRSIQIGRAATAAGR